MGNCFEICCRRGYDPVPDEEESIARSQSALDTAAVLHEKDPIAYKTVCKKCHVFKSPGITA
jgi:hypothetical protein